MNANLKRLIDVARWAHSISVCEQEAGSYTLVLKNGQAWLFVPPAELEAARKGVAHETTGMVEEVERVEKEQNRAETREEMDQICA